MHSIISLKTLVNVVGVTCIVTTADLIVSQTALSWVLQWTYQTSLPCCICRPCVNGMLFKIPCRLFKRHVKGSA